MNLTPEQEFEARASTLSREELYLMAHDLWCEMAGLKQLLRDRNAENVRLKNELDSSWRAQCAAWDEAGKR